MKVKAYFRKTKDGTRETAYLHCTINGVRRRNSTGITIPAKPTTTIEKAERAEGLRMLDAMRAKMEMEIAEGKSGIKTTFGKRKDFIKFVDEYYRNEHNISNGTISVRKCFLSHIKKCFGVLDCKNVDKTAVDKFINYMQSLGRQNRTIANMLKQFRMFVNIGVKQGLIIPFEVERIKFETKKREFLTAEEMSIIENAFVSMDKQSKECYKIFLFCCYTGLRISDAMSLKYSHIIRSADDKLIIRKEQVKTKNIVVIPLNEKARNLIDTNQIGNDKAVFEHRNTNNFNAMLRRHNPIKKYLSSHIARHTFAVQLLERGADIYGVSRLLGHSSVRTTEIYADMTTSKAVKIVSLLDD